MTTDDKMATMNRPEHDAARAHVRTERERRAWSARDAATRGGITNTVWSKFEAGGNLTPGVRKAVAVAFGWPQSWPERLPELTPEPAAREDALMLRLDHVVELVQQLLEGQSSAVLRLIELERMTGELLSERQPSSRRRPAAGG